MSLPDEYERPRETEDPDPEDWDEPGDRLCMDSQQGPPAQPPENRWTAAPSGRKGIDTLSMRAVQEIPWLEFQRQNAGRNLELGQLQQGEYRLNHPTTGQLEDGWRVQSTDGKTVKLTKNLQMEVAAGDHSGLVERMPGVPDEFVKSIEDKLKELPENVRANLKNAGYKIICAKDIPAAIPELGALTPRGWDRRTTFLDSDGTHDNISRRIIAPVNFRHNGEVQPTFRPEVVVHQVGHALDFANSMMSNSDEFRNAFLRDMARIQNQQDHRYRYFSQREGAGAQEGFASLFGLVLTGPENEGDREWLTDNFPNSIAAIRKQIKSLK